MKYLIAFFLFTSTAFALTYQVPTPFQVIGHACGGGLPVRINVTGFDATNSTYTGYAYAVTSCSAGGRGSGNSYWAGCDAAVWDSTGALVSLTRLWVTNGHFYPPYASCLDR